MLSNSLLRSYFVLFKKPENINRRPRQDVVLASISKSQTFFNGVKPLLLFFAHSISDLTSTSMKSTSRFKRQLCLRPETFRQLATKDCQHRSVIVTNNNNKSTRKSVSDLFKLICSTRVGTLRKEFFLKPSGDWGVCYLWPYCRWVVVSKLS